MTKHSIYACVALAVLVSFSTATAHDNAEARALAVVVHKSSPVESVSIEDLRNVWMGNLRVWPDSSVVVIIGQPEDHAVQLRALELLVNTTPAGYDRQLWQLHFQGKSIPIIKVLNSDENVIKFVCNYPGAIAVVNASSAEVAGSRVKILKINGKLPGESGYLLRSH